VITGCVSGFENQDVQFEDLVDKLNLERDTSRNPVFDIMMMVQNFSKGGGPGMDENPAAAAYQNPSSKFDMTFFVDEQGDDIFIKIEYYTAVFKPETIHRMASHLQNIIKAAGADFFVKLKDIEMISDEEKKKVIYEFNDTGRDYPKDKTIDRLFEEQAEKTPDHIGLVEPAGQVALSYQELNDQSGRLAGLLIKKGVPADSIVAIMMERSIELVIGIMGILKSGGAYLPIDPQYPQERIDYMLKDSGAQIIVGDRHACPQIQTIVGDWHACPQIPQIPQIHHSNLAYVIYTSGSTGKPKGVMVEHRGLVNYIWWAAKNYVKGERATFPLYTSISFDLTVTSIFTPLVTGNTIVVYADGEKNFLLEKIIDDQRVDVIKLTPSHLKSIRDKKVGKGSVIKRFIVGGEELETRLAEDIFHAFNGEIEIYNEYGPTETVVGSMIYKFSPGLNNNRNVLIGVPAANTRIYILSKDGNVMPVGVPGEIYIAGAGVARGYLNRPGLTAWKFAGNPFEGGGKMYRTGDLARRLPDGNIEFLGRMDNQVKIRGYRIELGEIENRLLKLPGLKGAVLVAREEKESGDKYLCAYIVSDREFDAAGAREFLLKELPDYMIPSYFVRL
ncbi:MAG TPA: amino acid adenylation domain-containing protein, partial [Candidatus Deferrimicrobium sp.]|nr:amino acid adenylation domain-containing protein [Candidatus Deferrimicrobium sp.]